MNGNVTVTVVSDDDLLRPLAVHLKNATASLHKKFEKCFQMRIRKEDIKPLQAWCKRQRVIFKGVPPSYNRIPNRRPSVEIQTSKELYDSLYEYQKIGVRTILQTLGGRALLGDEMGLGKTRQALACISHYFNSSDSTRILIVCPSYLQPHWRAGVRELVADDAELWDKKECPPNRIIIMSYNKLFTRPIEEIPWYFVVADESHYLKNRASKRTRAFMPVAHKAKSALLMTGTPALNRPCELFAQMHAIRPQHVRSYHQFAIRFCNGQRTRYGFDDSGSSNSDELRWLLKKEYMIRRLKDDELDLPPKTRIHITLDVAMKKLKALNETKAELASLGYSKQDMFKRQMLISRCFCLTGEAKADSTAKWVCDAAQSGEPFIVFAHHKIVLDTIQARLEAAEVTHMRIDGSVPVEERARRAEDFQSGKVQVAVLSLLAAGTGLTLTRTCTVVFAELYWVPGVILQAEDRAHRVGQKKKVTILYLIGKDTVDDRVYPQITQKLKILDSAVDGRTDRTMEPVTIF